MTTDTTPPLDETWGSRIHTARGTCSLEMRLEHNGYYSGGWVEGSEINTLPDNAVLLEDF